jgi:hypothetical protein
MTTADTPLPDPPPPVTATDWPDDPTPAEPASHDEPVEEGGDVDYDGHAGAGPF